jgi:hypothetical protein
LNLQPKYRHQEELDEKVGIVAVYGFDASRGGAPLMAQNPHYNNGPGWRVIYLNVKPGLGDKHSSDLGRNFKPVYDEFKKQGW